MGWRLPALQASASLRALPEAFPLRGRWAALAARMRCSRRCGVILIYLCQRLLRSLHLTTAYGGASPQGEAFVLAVSLLLQTAVSVAPPGSLLLEEKVASETSRMRCSRRGGVILILYFCQRLLRSLHLTTACGGASPQGEAFGKVSAQAFSNVLLNYCTLPSALKEPSSFCVPGCGPALPISGAPCAPPCC